MLIRLIKFILSLFSKKENPPESNVQDGADTNPSESENEIDGDYVDPHDPFEQQSTNTEDMKDYSNIMVHIDNGHASSTPGKRSPYSANKVLPALDFYEYKSNREIAEILRQKLESKGFKVNMVCPEIDEDIKLTVRAKRTNDMKNENYSMKHIFISIHSNACGNGAEWNSARGWSAWTTKGQNNSDKLADCLYDAAEEILPKHQMTIRKDMSDGDRDYEENFTVIYSANMPAVLTENLFFTNVTDTAFLLSPEGKEAIAEIHLQGIMKFADKYLI